MSDSPDDPGEIKLAMLEMLATTRRMRECAAALVAQIERLPKQRRSAELSEALGALKLMLAVGVLEQGDQAARDIIAEIDANL